MSREVTDQENTIIHNEDDLLRVFQEGARPRDEWKIGIEFERFVLDAQTGKSLPFEGEGPSVQKLLKAFLEKTRWTPVFDQGKLISLTNKGSAITLEPGGQLEISASAHAHIFDSCMEILNLVDVFDQVGRDLGVFYARTGVPPFTTFQDANWVPKTRYKTMRAFHQDDDAFMEMMSVTASVQINFDYLNEQDCARKVQACSQISPVVGAMFANSFFEQGKPNGYLSRRIQIWDRLDPARSGIKSFFVDGSFSYEAYRDYMLDVPMYFVSRDGAYRHVQHQTFRQYMKSKPWGDVTEQDWLLHLTTTFPEVRLKDHLEFRTIDSNPLPLVIGSAALIKGLMHDADNVDKILAHFEGVTLESIEQALRDVAKEGMQATWLGKPVYEHARSLYAWAMDVLPSPEKKYLKQVEPFVTEGVSPARKLLESLDVDDPEVWKQL